MLTCSTIATEISDEVKQSVKSRVEFGLSQSIIIGLYENGEVDYFRYGVTDIIGDKTPNKDTVFEIGSISKVFTSTLLATKVAAGQLQLADPVKKHLPQSCRSDKTASITLEMLATHHSGLPRMPSNHEPQYYKLKPVGYTRNDLCDYLINADELSQVGIEYSYSNLGMGLLGVILETNSGQSLNALLNRNIFDKLGLDNSGIGASNVDASKLAQGHHGVIRTPASPNGALDGAGAVLSTAQDLIKFMRAHFKDKKTPLDNAFDLTLASRKSAWEGTEIGLGWHIQENDLGEITYWHNGSKGGFHGFIAMDIHKKKAIVVLANSGGDGNDDIGFHLMNSSYPIKPTPTYKQVKLDDSLLNQYQGIFDTEFGVPIEITKHDGQLKATFGEQFALNIYPRNENTFFYRAINAQISFDRDENSLLRLYLHQDGETYPAKLRR